MSRFDRFQRRAEARRLYDDFSKMWRRDARLAGRYGKPGTRKPTFSQWSAWHDAAVERMRKSTPQDVREFIADGQDPWADMGTEAPAEESGERGVVTIPMVGGSEDE